MDLSKVNDKDWKDFEKKFPKAASFLRMRSLIGEYKFLRDNPRRNEWQEKRFRELAKLWIALHDVPEVLEVLKDMNVPKEVADE